MPLRINLRHLARHEVELEGTLSVEELELDLRDEMVRANGPLQYDLEAQSLDDSVLVRGKLVLPLECECVRCLKPFKFRLELPDWTAHLPLKGEEAVTVVDDSVDLTAPIREDILLALPAHPVCKTECGGLAGKSSGSKKKKAQAEQNPSWSELDKLKFK
jgi:uncharacterized metal-binding protein YceD (DUF177 family)